MLATKLTWVCLSCGKCERSVCQQRKWCFSSSWRFETAHCWDVNKMFYCYLPYSTSLKFHTSCRFITFTFLSKAPDPWVTKNDSNTNFNLEFNWRICRCHGNVNKYRSRNSGRDFWWNQLPCGPAVLTPISCTKLKIHLAHKHSQLFLNTLFLIFYLSSNLEVDQFLHPSPVQSSRSIQCLKKV